MIWKESIVAFALCASLFTLLTGCSNNSISNRNEPKSTQYPVSSQNLSSTEKTESSKTLEVKSKLFTNISNFKIDDPKTYFNERFNFSVDYPITWETQPDISTN